ncbi:helix-turn-helix domain-containing protein, partial [bacterium]
MTGFSLCAAKTVVNFRARKGHAPLLSLGEQFRAAREARGVTLSEVAERIHIRSVYLQAIEEEDWPSIGAAVYVRGFLRTYARFLGLDPEGAVAQFNDLTGIQPHAPAGTASLDAAPARHERSGPSIWVWLAGIVAVALLAIVGYSFWQLETPGAPRGGAPLAAPTAASAPESPGPPSVPAVRPTAEAALAAAAVASAAASPSVPPVSGPVRLTLTWTAPSWVRVVVDAKQVSEGTFPAGTVRSYQGTRITLRVGNAGGVQVNENGHDLGPLGGAGNVVDRIFATAN